MAATPDILHSKTAAELRFFVDNPSYYQPELVAAAQRELRRRGPEAVAPAIPTPPAPLPAPPLAGEPAAVAPRPPAPLAAAAPAAYYPAAQETAGQYDYAEPAQRPWLLVGSVAVVLSLAGLGFWFKSPSPSAAATQAPPAATAPAATSPGLEATPASPIPYYNAESYVDKALAQVPAAEKRDEQRLNQYRAVSLRFWAAQNPSAHLIGQAQAGQANPVFGPQVQLVLGLWHDFDRTQVYSYSFGPVMADHLARMKVIAQYQREALKELANDAEAQRPPHLDDDQTLAHQQALPPLLAALERKAGPITVHL
ncbi:hypothetical protein [Hymenobacter bucti]|uniref:Uncharacterized protein n=1 Tax=Hymenobacter bucti TaxID=1844114 RepID=A0ABW4QY76_9BACT